jgi:hypothetical protein
MCVLPPIITTMRKGVHTSETVVCCETIRRFKGNYMYHLLYQSMTLHFVFVGSYDSQYKQGLFF